MRRFSVSPFFFLPFDQLLLIEIIIFLQVKPSFLQNRFYADTNYDKEIRAYCKEMSIRYQSFWTLTANPKALQSAEVQRIARKHGRTPAQIFYRFIQSLDIVPLSGE